MMTAVEHNTSQDISLQYNSTLRENPGRRLHDLCYSSRLSYTAYKSCSMKTKHSFMEGKGTAVKMQYKGLLEYFMGEFQ